MKSKYFNFPVIVCRKISSPENEQQKIAIYVGQAPITSFLEIPDEENVRKYTIEASERKRPTSVHLAIRDTLNNRPEKFFVLNGGISIVSEQIHLESDQKTIKLCNPSIINGSQTRGVINDFLRQNQEYIPDKIPNVKFEIIVTTDYDLITECSISRNNQIPVRAISILGAREVFNALNKRIFESCGKKLRTSETDRSDDFVNTEKLLQVISALIPTKLWKATDRETYSKAFTYSGQAGPLRLFEKVHNEAEGITPVSSEKRELSLTLYNFYLDIAPEALKLYEKWSSGSPFKGANLKKKDVIVRDSETSEILFAHDGIIFPIIAAHSEFIQEINKKWVLKIPDINIEGKSVDEKLVEAAKEVFSNIANRKVHIMGRTEACYSHIRLFTQTVSSMLLLTK